jgi:DNA-binding CsgD family transcriptional regulator
MSEKIILKLVQFKIAKLVAEGKTNKSIAIEFHYTLGTVKQYVSKIFEVTGAINRTHLSFMLSEEKIICEIDEKLDKK